MSGADAPLPEPGGEGAAPEEPAEPAAAAAPGQRAEAGPVEPALAVGSGQPAAAEKSGQPDAAEGPGQPVEAGEPAVAEGPGRPATAEGPQQPAAEEGPVEQAPAEGSTESVAEGPGRPAAAEGPKEPAAEEGPVEQAPAEAPTEPVAKGPGQPAEAEAERAVEPGPPEEARAGRRRRRAGADRATSGDLLWRTGLPNLGTLVGRELSAARADPLTAVLPALLVALVALLGYLPALAHGVPLTAARLLVWVELLGPLAAPLLTMGTLAGERRAGTLELLLATPVRTWELVAAKWAVSFLRYLALIAPTAVFVLLAAVQQPAHAAYRLLGHPLTLPLADYGSFAAGYCGLALLGGAAVAAGLVVSSLAPGRLAAAVLGVALLLALGLLPEALILPDPVAGVAQALDARAHAGPFLEGLLRPVDAVYFGAAILGLLYAAGCAVDHSARWAARPPAGRPGDRGPAQALAGLGVLLGFAAGGLALGGGPAPAAWLSLLVGAALLVAGVLLAPDALRALARPAPLAGWRSVLGGAALIGALGVLYAAADQAPAQLDVSGVGAHTLAPTSVAAVRQLDSELTVTGYFPPDEARRRRQVAELLSLYAAQSGRLAVSYSDPAEAPAQALRFGVALPGSLVLQYAGRTPVVLAPGAESESDLTGAILRLETDRNPEVCWASGAGERDLQSTDDRSGYSAARDLMASSGYTVRLLPAGAASVPADCDLVAVVGPTQALSPAIRSALAGYLDRGGSLFLAVDPGQEPGVLESIDQVIAAPGLHFARGLVVEPDPARHAAGDPAVPATLTYGSSPLTRGLAGGEPDPRAGFFPQATAIVGAPPPGVRVHRLVTTSQGAYRVPVVRGSLEPRPGDPRGPFTLMETLESPAGAGPTRVLLVGTSAVAENRTLGAAGDNAALYLASLDWLSGQEDLIGPSPKPPRAAPLPTSRELLAANGLLTVLVVPVLIAGAGWALRRR